MVKRGKHPFSGRPTPMAASGQDCTDNIAAIRALS